MRLLILTLIPTLLSACSDDLVATSNTETGGDPSTGNPSTSPTTETTAPTTGSTPGTTDGSDSMTASGTSNVPPDTTVDVTFTSSSASSDTDTTLDTSSTTDETGTSSGTTGGVMGCGMDGPEIDANLVHLGVDPGCGPVEFLGTNVTDSAGPVYMLDGCPCGANCLKPDPWTLTLAMPLDWLPGKLPACPRIVVERQKSKKGCELVGMAIWDSQAPDNSPARFHAGSLLGPIAAAEGELKVAQIEAETCDCDDCCNIPTRLDLEFSALGDSSIVAEGAEGTVANNEFGYNIKNFQSHLTGICDDSPHVDWVLRRF